MEPWHHRSILTKLKINSKDKLVSVELVSILTNMNMTYFICNRNEIICKKIGVI